MAMLEAKRRLKKEAGAAALTVKVQGLACNSRAEGIPKLVLRVVVGGRQSCTSWRER